MKTPKKTNSGKTTSSNSKKSTLKSPAKDKLNYFAGEDDDDFDMDLSDGLDTFDDLDLDEDDL